MISEASNSVTDSISSILNIQLLANYGLIFSEISGLCVEHPKFKSGFVQRLLNAPATNSRATKVTKDYILVAFIREGLHSIHFIISIKIINIRFHH